MHSMSIGDPNLTAIICMPMSLCFSCRESPLPSASLRSKGWLYKALARRRMGSILFAFYSREMAFYQEVLSVMCFMFT